AVEHGIPPGRIPRIWTENGKYLDSITAVELRSPLKTLGFPPVFRRRNPLAPGRVNASLTARSFQKGSSDARRCASHIPCRHPHPLFDQHAADRRPRQTDLPGHRDHPGRDLAPEIPRGGLTGTVIPGWSEGPDPESR